MKYKRIYLLLAVCFISHIAVAHHVLRMNMKQSHYKHFYIGFNTNMELFNFFTYQTTSDDGFFKSYTSHNASFAGSISMGAIINISNTLNVRLGVSYQYRFPQKILGDYYMRPGDLAGYYSYKITSKMLTINPRLYWKIAKPVSLFVGGSIGGAMIHSSAIDVTMISPKYIRAKPYSRSNTAYSLSYGLVGGIAVHIHPHVNIELSGGKLWMGNQYIIAGNSDESMHKIDNGMLSPWLTSVALNFQF